MISWNLREVEDFHQASTVPFRWNVTGLEFCLITSTSGRWGFPKGVIDPGETYMETAVKESVEEAGLHGRLLEPPLGCYEVFKYGRINTVVVSLMEVTQCDAVWDEVHFRQRRWVGEDEARRLLCRPSLRECLDAAVARINKPSRTPQDAARRRSERPRTAYAASGGTKEPLR
jgi:8-oxo-dGTP pyrophosphatase MutT (NUDIX family)